MVSQQLSAQQVESIQASFMNKVYAWMTLALSLTGFVAYRAAESEALTSMLVNNPIGLMILFIVELGIVWWMSANIDTINSNLAIGLFLLYSALNGITLSLILLVYTGASVASTFFITATTFGVMSAYGYFTQKDLSSWGNILFMGLIGIIIASVVNIFLQSNGLYYLISYVGVLIFVGLTAYDTQKLKRMSMQIDADSEEGRKGAIMGALALYLDFINMFIFLLRILGDRR